MSLTRVIAPQILQRLSPTSLQLFARQRNEGTGTSVFRGRAPFNASWCRSAGRSDRAISGDDRRTDNQITVWHADRLLCAAVCVIAGDID